MSDRPPFVIECQDCEMDCATDQLEEALTFAVKHQQHTGHTLTWERSNLIDGVISIPQRIRWKVRCGECDTERIFDDRERAEQFCEEHETYAGHTPQEPERIELPKISELETSAVDDVIEYCFEKAEAVDVVPTEAILEAFEEAGIGRKRIARELEKAEMENDVYHVGEGFLAR